MEITLKKFARVAAAGALAVSAGALGLYLLIGFAALPSRTAGIDRTHSALAWISLAVPISLLIAAHLVYARVLLRYASED
jgi:hypothetical protein